MDLLESGWSKNVSNDPKHRPQVLDRPSTTVRKEWCRRPQEAHLADGSKYRRLSVAEIARIQSFPLEWVDIEGTTDNERIAVLGNAVPPLLSKAIATIIKQEISFNNKTLLEICAGIGGLSYGFDYLAPIAKIELWDIAVKILKSNKPWPASCVIEGYAQDYDYASVSGKVGLLCGGPPCQPWSQAGHKKGASDPRDVMGFTPTAIAQCEPEVFLSENVPGLFSSSEHRDYVTDLLKRMANPKEGLRYGIATVILNTADYGVPQIRRRVIILGIKNKSNTYAHKILNKIKDCATHHDPTKPAIGKKPWVTLRQAFVDIPVTESWYKWDVTEETLQRLQLVDKTEFIDDDIEEQEDINDTSTILNLGQFTKDEAIATMQLDNNNKQQDNKFPTIPRIELLWPGKNDKLSYSGTTWKFTSKTEKTIQHSLIYDKEIGSGPENLGYVIKGNILSSLEALKPFVPSAVQMVYFDSPRLSVLQNESAPGFAVSTWLSLVQQAALNSYKSLKNTGFFVLQTNEEMAHYGRQVLDEVFGHTHHVSTFAWQKKYAPQNDKTKNNPTDVFDYIIVYSKCPLENLPKVGILQTPDKIIDDGDWRGCYTAGHKGAKSGNESTKFKVCAPPYRWKILNSHLPEGRYWFDEITGVLWFEEIKSAGNYWFEVECKDSEGCKTTEKITFSTLDPEIISNHFELPKRIWWLLKNDNDIIPGGNLHIDTENMPVGIVGNQFSLILKASGGKPFTMKSSAPGANRYWEFSLSTLVEAIANTTASFGSSGSALPSRKTYHDRENSQVRMAVMNWLPWQDFGKSEDASRHVKSLYNTGLTSGILNLTAKPQKLLNHLITLFAPNEGDTIIALGDLNAAMASVAFKTKRKCIHITGNSPQDLEAWENTASKRILAVLSGFDSAEVEKDDPMPIEYSVYSGYIDCLKVPRTKLIVNSSTGAIEITESINESIADFYAGLIGTYRKNINSNNFYGFDNKRVIVFDSDDILDTGMISYLANLYKNESLTIIAERLELSDDTSLPRNISVLHAPFDLFGR